MNLKVYYRSWGDIISQNLIKDIVKLVQDVTDAKAAYPEAKVPAAELIIFKLNDKRRTKNNIPNLKQTKHDVRIRKQVNGQEVEQTLSFHMNSPSEVLRLLVANPLVFNQLTKLPDHTEGEHIESYYQSHKWKTHNLFQHPMVSVKMNGVMKDIWVGDLVEAGQMLMVVERFYTLKHSIIMAEGYQVVNIENRLFLHNMPNKIHVEAIPITRIAHDSPETLPLYFENNVLSTPDLLQYVNAIVSRIRASNPLICPSLSSTRKFKPVKVVPLNFFTDNMSGGSRMKKHNKFDS